MRRLKSVPILALLVVLATGLWIPATGQNSNRKRAALVVQIQGTVLHPERSGHRKMVKLNAFEGVDVEEALELWPSSSVTLAFLQNNQRFRLENKGSSKLKAKVLATGFEDHLGVAIPAAVREGTPTSLQGLDLSKMGGGSGRTVERVLTLQERPLIYLNSRLSSLVAKDATFQSVLWQTSDSKSENAESVTWQSGKSEVVRQTADVRALQLPFSVPPGSHVKLHIGASLGNSKDYTLDLYRIDTEQSQRITLQEQWLLDNRSERLEHLTFLAWLKSEGLTAEAMDWLEQCRQLHPNAEDWQSLQASVLKP